MIVAKQICAWVALQFDKIHPEDHGQRERYDWPDPSHPDKRPQCPPERDVSFAPPPK